VANSSGWGAFNPTTAQFDTIPDANNTAYLNGASSFEQTTGETIAAGVTYKLKFKLGRRKDVGSVSVKAGFYYGSTLLAEQTFSQSIVNAFSDAELTYTAPSSGAMIGQALKIRFTGIGSEGQPNLDQVVLQKAVTGGIADYVYDLAGRAVAEIDAATGVWTRTEIYAGGAHLATYAAGTTYFTHADWLGTVRARTGVSGNLVESFASLPYGDALSPSGGVNPLHFTGQERDGTSGEGDINHFWFRDYSSIQGRWLTPDPAGLAAAHLFNPQSLNRYAYVMNNPVNAVDPSGLMMVLLDDDDRRGGGGGRIGFVNLNAGIMTGVTGNEFDLMNIPVTVKTWGWIPITPNTTNFVGANSPYGNVTNLAYFGLTTTVVGSGLDLVNQLFLLFLPLSPHETPTQAFNRLYPDPTLPATAVVKGPPAPPSQQTIEAICTIDALNANNGLGLPAPGVAPSGTESVANGIVFQQSTQHGVRTMNTTAPNINLVGPLAAPGIFVQNSYYNCLSGH